MDTRPTEAAERSAPGAERDCVEAVYRKVTRRLLPFLGLCYLAAYLDRVNVGFAKLEMANDLGLSEVAYGLGAGIFFIGYFLFEIPSNLILHRVGARSWLARIMISWALVSAASALLAPIHFYWGPRAAAYAFCLIRFLLGIAEAGFFPGVLLYLTYWYPPSRRSLALGQFIIAQPVAFVIGAPISGLILATCEGLAGLRAWQWLYILEALPAVLLGVVLFRRLDRRVADAAWLRPAERLLVNVAVEAEASPGAIEDCTEIARKPAIWFLALAYFLLILGAYGLSFWLPSIIAAAGVAGSVAVGLFTALPYGAGVLVMLVFASRARTARQARVYAAAMCLLSAAGLVLSAWYDGRPWPMMIGMIFGVAGYLTATALFWRLPSEELGGKALAAGLAAVNAIGNLGGFAGPYLVGAVVARSGGTAPALLVLAGSLAACAAVLAAGLMRNTGSASVTAVPGA